MSAVEGASWTGIAMATSGSFHQPRLSRAIHPASQARLSNVPILHLIASARARTASQALRFKVPGQQAKHPNPPLHPSLPSLAVVAIPLSSSYPPLPVSRRPLPPPWRPTTASLARCMFLPSVVTSCQGTGTSFMADHLEAPSTSPSPMRASHPSPCAPSKLTRSCPPWSHDTLRPCPAPARNKIQWSVSNTRPPPTGCFESPSTPSSTALPWS